MIRDPLLRKFAAVLIAIAAVFPFVAFAQSAGQFDFVKGNVVVLNAQGQPRVAHQGMQINSGDTLVTGEGGRAHVRFSDGGYISLQPDTRFRIDEYNYRGVPDGTEKGFFSLVKGGLRAISGAIGKINQTSYQVTTPVATIGIRGTHYRLRFCENNCFDAGKLVQNGLYASVGEGQISVGNRVGNLQLPQGRAGFVADANSPPVPTDRSVQVRPGKIERAALLPEKEGEKEKEQEKGRDRERERERRIPQLSLKEREAAMQALKEREAALIDMKEREALTLELKDTTTATIVDTRITIAAGELRDAAGLPTNLKDATTVIDPAFGIAIADDGQGFRNIDAGVIDATGGLLSFADAGAGVKADHGDTVIEPGAGGDKLLVWGRWTGGTALDSNAKIPLSKEQGLHYVFTTIPTPQAFLETGTGTLSYAVLGATTPTSDQGIAGTFVKGGLNLTLGASPTVDLGFVITLDKFNYDTRASGIPVTASSATFQLTNATSITSGCSATCTTSIHGIIAGPSAERAGFVYEIQDSGLANIHGAVALSSTAAVR